VALVSLVSVWSRNWCYLCEGVERVEKGEIVEIPNTDAVLMHVSENRVGWEKRQGEYPTLSATFCFGRSYGIAMAAARAPASAI
jgi:hypothetical protein